MSKHYVAIMFEEEVTQEFKQKLEDKKRNYPKFTATEYLKQLMEKDK